MMMWRGMIVTLAVAPLPAVPVAAQTTVSPAAAGQVAPAVPGNAGLPMSDADNLAAEIRILATNPEDFDALVRAGDYATRVGDLSAASAFFTRADRIAPQDSRLLAGRAALAVHQEHPGEALRLFERAEAGGFVMTPYLADRGLAYDLVGDQPRAQRDYRSALRQQPNDEIVRRLALSLAISGRREQALDLLEPLLRRSDRGGWRVRAFVLALTGDVAGANDIAKAMLPSSMASGLAHFFAALGPMGASERAFAVHFGELRTTPERIADARMAPVLPPIPLEPLPQPPKPVVAVAAAAEPRSKRDRRRRVPPPVTTPPPAVTVAARPPLPAPPREQIDEAPAPAPAPAPVALAQAEPVRVVPAVSTPAPRQATPPPEDVRIPVNPDASSGVATPSIVAKPVTVPPPIKVPAAQPPSSLSAAPSPGPSQAGTAPSVTPPVPTRVPATPKPVPSNEPDPSRPVEPVRGAPERPVETVTPATPPVTVPAVSPASTVSAPAASAAAPAAAPPPSAPATAPSPKPDDAAPAQASSVAASSAKASEASTQSPPPPAGPAQQTMAPVKPKPAEKPADKPAAKPTNGSSARPMRSDDALLATIVAGLDAGVPASRAKAAKSPPAAPDSAKAERAPAKDAEDCLPVAAAKGRKGKAAPAPKSIRAKGKGSAKVQGCPVARDDAAASTDAKGKKNKKDDPAKKEPARVWVQVAGGANERDLAKAWAAVKAKAPAAFKGRSGWSTPLRATNRVLTGPFKSRSDAQDFVNLVAKSGISAFVFESEPGQKIDKLGTQ